MIAPVPLLTELERYLFIFFYNGAAPTALRGNFIMGCLD